MSRVEEWLASFEDEYDYHPVSKDPYASRARLNNWMRWFCEAAETYEQGEP